MSFNFVFSEKIFLNSFFEGFYIFAARKHLTDMNMIGFRNNRFCKIAVLSNQGTK